MAVYVDNMRAQFGRMVMCHLAADTRDELLAMVDRIGVSRKWIQAAGTWREHFDISLTKRALAVEAGAVELSQKDLVRRLLRKAGRSPGQGGATDRAPAGNTSTSGPEPEG